MKLTLDRLKETIWMVGEMNGELVFNYVPLSTLDSTEELAGLYYSGRGKIIISKKYIMIGRSDILELNEENIIKLHTLLESNISNYITEVFEKFDWEYEEIKYFSHGVKKYNKFKKEVLKLKNK